MDRKEYLDEYVECGLKNWAARQAASASCRSAVLDTAETDQNQLPAPDHQRAWMERRRRFNARQSEPVTDPMESLGFSWIWALHLTVTPLRSMR